METAGWSIWQARPACAVGALVWRRGGHLLKLICAGACLIAVVGMSPWRVGLVDGHSMSPALEPGSAFLYDRDYYPAHPLCVGDIVVLRHAGTVWVKRVYASEGASFWAWRDPRGEEVLTQPVPSAQRERFARLEVLMRDRLKADVGLVRVQVPAGQVFLIGDGPNSDDSRKFGPVEIENIIGRVIELPGQRLGPGPSWAEHAFPAGGLTRQDADRPPSA